MDANQGWVAGSLWPDLSVMLHTETGGGGQVAAVEEDGQRGGTPEQARVSAPYPNPFNPSTSISYAVPGAGAQPVSVEVFDLRGRRIRTLVDGVQGPGEHIVNWDGLSENREPVTSGVYTYKITIGSFTTRGKLTLLK